LHRNAFQIIMQGMAEKPAVDTTQNGSTPPVTRKCKWCKEYFPVTRIYPVQIYCKPSCCKAHFDHRRELRIADKIAKRRQRLRAKRAKAQQK